MGWVVEFDDCGLVKGQSPGEDTQLRGRVGDQLRVQDPELARIKVRKERWISMQHIYVFLQSRLDTPANLARL